VALREEALAMGFAASCQARWCARRQLSGKLYAQAIDGVGVAAS